MTKTNTGLVAYARAQLGLPYWYGTFGQTATEALHNYKRSQYPKYYTAKDFTRQYGQRVHDCVGLIKGYLWSNSPTAAPKYNGDQDVSANGMRKACTLRGDIATIPAVPGVLVFYDGHVGVYDGTGTVIEARGHAYGVVETRLSDRPWKEWGYCPYITYTEAPSEPVADKSTYTLTLPLLRKGDRGEAVLALQRLLVACGYDCGRSGADGIFGNATENAVLCYQEDNDLTPDGIVGEETMGSLMGVGS